MTAESKEVVSLDAMYLHGSGINVKGAEAKNEDLTEARKVAQDDVTKISDADPSKCPLQSSDVGKCKRVPGVEEADRDGPNANDEKIVSIHDLGIKKDNSSDGGKDETTKEKAVDNGGSFAAYRKLFAYSTKFDIILRIVGIFAACAAGVTLPIMTIVFGQLVNDFNGWAVGNLSPDGLRAVVNRGSLYFVYLFIAKFSLVYIHTFMFTLTATRTTRAIRYAYIRALLRQDIAYFDTCTPGSVATSISNNADMIQTGLSEKVGVAIQSLAMLTAAFIVAFTQGWKLTLVVATTLPAAVVTVGITVALDARHETKIIAIYATAAGLVEEALSSIRNVTALGASKKFQERYDTYLDQAKVFGVKKGPILGIQYASEFFVLHCAYALAFWYGVRLYVKGEMADGGKVVTVLFAVLLGTSSITAIAPAIGDFTKAGAAAKSVLELIEQEPKIDPIGTHGIQLSDEVKGHIVIKGVTFAYPARPTMDVLNNMGMEFEAQKTTAIVGASGSGKSTIVALIERWYDPASGSFELDGMDIKNINVKSLRSQIGLVQQEPVLFNDTIYNNVVHGLYGTRENELPEDEKRKLVMEACIEANADTFIQDLPEKYDTVVGERGGFISGGQKQRVAIARSIIKNPRILLLDEATSALDPTAEGIVQAALDKVSRTRTTIMIAHKLSTVKKADKIVVMNQGTVIEQGTHESLLEAKGAYSRLVAAQNLGYADEDDSEVGLETSTPDDEIGHHIEKSRTIESMNTPPLENEDIARKLSLFKCLCIIIYERRKLWPLFLGGFIAAIVAGGVFPAQAIVFSRAALVFQYTGKKIIDEANFWTLMFFVLAIGTLLSYAGIGFFMTVAAFLTARVYRSEYFAAMLGQDISYFDIEGNSSGSLTSRLSTDPSRLQDTVSANLGLIMIVIFTLLSCCTLSLILGWKLALVAIFGCLPALFFAGFMRMRLEMGSQDRNAKMYQESARFASEAVGAIRTVSALTLEGKVMSNYGDRLDFTVSKAYKHIAITMALFGLSDSMELIAMALAFWYGGQLMSTYEYDPQTFFVIFTAIIFGGQAAGFLFGFTMNTTKAHAAANHILHLRSLKPAINSSTGIPPTTDHSDKDSIAIEFANVRFSYPTRPELPVLRGLNIKIRHGQSVGIVGASGCGKTTVIGLLERFYDINSGSIKINSQELKTLDVRQHRATMALVSQDTTLYQGSIRDNVLLGIPTSIISTLSEAELSQKVESACRDANIHDFITSLPEGYNTDTGSRGLALSGGQRQRLAIARALIRDPSVLLLDEATSALDSASEEVVQRALENAARGRTTVAVAHRLSTIRGCDVIFVLEKGRVVEVGTHEELIRRRGGRYAEMVRAQGLDVEAK